MTRFDAKLTAAKKARLNLYDDIWPGVIDVKTVNDALIKLGEVEEIEIHVNSRGGSAYEGLGIASLLRDHPAKVFGVVEGLAASAATLPLMVCDSVRIPKNALFMIPEPWNTVTGGIEDFRKEIVALEAIVKVGIALYCARCKKAPDDVAAMLRAETWFTGEQAVAAGFADVTDAEVSDAKLAIGPVQLPWPGGFKFKKAPPKLEALWATLPADQPTASDDAIQAAVLAERVRLADVAALLQLAGKPERISQSISDGSMIEQLRKSLYVEMCRERSPHDCGGSSQELPAKGDGNGKYRSEYAQQRHALEARGISEAAYVASRRIDDGIDKLTPKSAA